MTGFQIIDLREALNMSRPELARALNVTPTTLANWEKHEPHNLGLEVLSGLYQAVFDVADQGAERSARIEKIASKLHLGLGSMLCFALLDHANENPARGEAR